MVNSNLSGQAVKGYELRELIGRGGFGAVYRAYQPLVAREVAIKIILPEYANLPNFIRRFDVEAQLIAQLEHIHIVPLYDYWRDPAGACLVMRLLRGGSLQDALESSGPWEIKSIARLLDQISSALAAAHRQGVIHRDLKPPNILLDEEQNAYLADFGIAKNLITGQQTVADDERFGSPAYISPEQVMGQAVSPQSDIYSLGVVLFMLLTGQTPFVDPSTTTVIRRHVTEPLPPLQVIRNDLPQALNMVIWRATAKQAKDRYPDALSLANDFRRVMSLEMGAELTGGATLAVPSRRISPSETGRTMMIDVPADPKNPYKGLRAFQEADAADFFGRSELSQRLVNRLEHAQFLAVIGPSGSGKSSLVMAGLIPTLRRGALRGSQDWFIAQMSPGSQPFVELEAALLSIAMKAPEGLAARLRAGDAGLLTVLGQILPLENAEVLLVIDQFEELFTMVSSEAERVRFINMLTAAVNHSNSHLRVIITLRADMSDRPLLYAELGDLIRQHNEIVLPLNTTEMRDAIVGPAQWLNMQFEADLVDTMVSDVSQQAGALPLLQFALTELFERREGFVLTNAAYEASGGVLGALARRADEVYEQLDARGRSAARQLFLRLVNPGEGTDDTRRRVTRYELEHVTVDKSAMNEVIEVFSRSRLLTLDREPATRAPTVEVAHEALIRVWAKLRTWVDASRDDLRLQRRLLTSTQEWLNAGKDPSFLATGARLFQFEALSNNILLSLSEDELNYVNTSSAARQRQTNLRRAAVGVLVVATVFALALAVFAFDRQNAALNEQIRADAQSKISRSRELAVTALTGVDDASLGLLLAVEAVHTADTFEAHNSLLTRIQSSAPLKMFLHGHQSAVRTAAYSPDGKWIASAAADGNLIIWNPESGQPAGQPLTGHSAPVNSIAFSPDSRYLLSGGADGSTRLWEVENGAQTALALDGHESEIWSVAFSPLGTLAAFGDANGQVLLWDVNERRIVGEPLSLDGELIHSMVFSPDGKLLITGSEAGTVLVWDVASRQLVGAPLEGHSNWVLSVTISPDGRLLASAGADSSIILWDTESQQPLGRFATGHRGWIRSIAFSSDGLVLASASADATVRLWSIETGDALGAPFAAHTDEVWSVAFSPDGKTLITASKDGSLAEWNLAASQPLGQPLMGHLDAVLSLAFSPDGRRLASAGGRLEATASQGNNIRVWDTASGEMIMLLEGHTRSVTSIAYSPDGRWIASGSGDRSIRLWNSETGEMIRQLDAEAPGLYIAVAFSPDGKILAAGSEDGLIRLWDVEDGVRLGEPLRGHTDAILDLAFNPDGSLLASASQDDTVILWDVAAREPMFEPLGGHSDDVTSVAFNASGGVVASGSHDGTIILWDAAAGRSLGQPLSGHSDWILALGFSADGRLLMSGGADNEIILWDAVLGRQLGRPFTDHQDWVTAVAFSPIGMRAASGSQDTRILFWDFNLQFWQEWACSAANRSLTEVEWRQYFPGETYRAICLS